MGLRRGLFGRQGQDIESKVWRQTFVHLRVPLHLAQDYTSFPLNDHNNSIAFLSFVFVDHSVQK
jgi:hypothetical protein